MTGNPGGPITLAKSAHAGPMLLAGDTEPGRATALTLRQQATRRMLTLLTATRAVDISEASCSPNSSHPNHICAQADWGLRPRRQHRQILSRASSNPYLD